MSLSMYDSACLPSSIIGFGVEDEPQHPPTPTGKLNVRFSNLSRSLSGPLKANVPV